VRNYKKEHASFPHESTVDQWFSESQFESYRQLGYHEVLASIEGMPPGTLKPLQEQLRARLVEFGFEVQNAQEAAGNAEKAGSQAEVKATTSTALPRP
jgi:hypothetical protein